MLLSIYPDPNHSLPTLKTAISLINKMLFLLFPILVASTPHILLPIALQSSTQLVSNSSELENFENMQYEVSLSAGTPPQTLTFIIDTGSSWLWMPSTACDCHESSTFNASASSSYVSSGSLTVINYAQGEVEGVLSSDTFTFSEDVQATGQVFILATRDSSLENLKSDGLIGLGFPSLSQGHPTLVQSLYEQGQIAEAVFSIYLNNKYDSYLDSMIILGGSDEATYGTGEPMYLAIDSEFGYWTTSATRMFIADKHDKDYTLVLLDSGSSFMYGPARAVETAHREIEKGADCFMSSGLLRCYCTEGEYQNFPDFTLEMQGNNFTVTPKNYLYYDYGICIVMIADSGDFYWLIGQPMFREYYSVFDYEGSRVTMYKAVSASEAKVGWIAVIAGAMVCAFIAMKFWTQNSRKELDYTRLTDKI